MAFDSSSDRSAQSRSTPNGSRSLPPEVARPSGSAWSALEADGIRWEGQVFVVGGGTDLPARLILTTRQFVLVSDGQVVLDVPRTWLRPGAQLIAEDGIQVFITPEGGKAGSDETDRLQIRARGGRGAAAQLVGAITGRIISPRTHPQSADARGLGSRGPNELPMWGDRVGAAMPMALPPLPDLDDDGATKQPWPPIEQQAIPASRPKPQSPRDNTPSNRRPGAASPTARTDRDPIDGAFEEVSVAAAATWAGARMANAPTETTGPVGRNARRIPFPTNARTAPVDDAQPYVAVEHHEFNRGLVWGLRLVILFVLLGTGLYFGRDRLYERLDLSFPANVEEQLGLSRNSDDISQLPASDDQAGSNGTGDDGSSTGSNNVPSDGTNGAPNGGAIQSDQEQDSGANDTSGATGGATDGDAGSDAPPTVTEVPSEPTAAPASDTSSNEDGGSSSDGAADTGVEPAQEPEEPTEEPTPVPTEEPTPVPTEEPTEIRTEVATEEPTQVPTEEPTQFPTEVPTEVPTQTPTEVPTEEPTPVPTEEPTQVPTEEPTQIPTEVPTEVPTQTPTQVPTEEPTQIPTEVPIEAPTQVPTEAPTQVPTQAPTQVPTATASAEPTLESQPPSVDPESPPAQSVADGTFRYSIQGAAIGDTIPELPGVNDVGAYGEWLVLSLYGENWTDTEQVFDMSQFRLLADGEEILLDVGNSWVSSQLGFTPAYGNTDAILWAPDEGHQFALTFLVPPDTETLVLQAGDQVIDLETALEESAPLTTSEDVPALPEYIDATVVEVVDGETIVIEQAGNDGIEQTVRYLGIDAPTDDDCFAEEATAANANLVDGKKVRIERQATDVDAKGNWVRDVWVEADDGRFFLAAETLVSEGAARAGISEPNTRFAGWLMGSESAAKATGEGLWGACDEEATTLPGSSEALIDPMTRIAAPRAPSAKARHG